MKEKSCRKFRFLIPLAIIAFIAVFGAIVFGLWNGVLTDVLGVKAITYWQALGILILAKIVFGGFPGRRCCGFRRRWHPEMMERWHAMTPEQRETMRAEMRQRFGDWPRPPWCDDAGDKPTEPEKT